jgi:AP-3 complex subunit beta
MLSKGNAVAEFFPDVVKNVGAKSIEVKKTVYIYLVHYADFNDSCREIALLSINSFQKDLAGSNQLIRGLALRVMTSIRVPDIIQVVCMCFFNLFSKRRIYRFNFWRCESALPILLRT